MTKFTIPIAEIRECATGKELIALGLKYKLTNTMAVDFARCTMDRRYKEKMKNDQKRNS